MKTTITLIIYLVFFSCSLQAQHIVRAEWSTIRGTNEPSNGLSVSWFSTEGILSGMLLRLNYAKTNRFEGADDNSYDSKILSLDIGKRWNSRTRKKVHVFFEMGLSGMALNTQSYYFYDGGYCYCDYLLPALPVAEVIQDPGGPPQKGVLHYNYNRKDYQVAFMPGAMYGGGLDLAIKKHFSLGLHIKNNAYYEYFDHNLLLYFSYGINAGYRF